MQPQFKSYQIAPPASAHPREHILYAARTVLERNGVRNTSIAAIRALWGGSDEEFRALFENDDDLLTEAIYQSRCAKTAQLFTFAPGISLRYNLILFGTNYLEYVLANEHLEEQRFILSQGRNSASLRKIFEYDLRVNWSRVGDFLNRFMKSPNTCRAKCQLAARQFKALLEFDLLERGMAGILPTLFRAELVQFVELVVDRFLNLYREDFQ